MIGTGYVGLVSGVCFADFGHIVTCIDEDAGKIERLNAGQMPIYEPGLEELVERNVREQRLFFTSDPEVGVGEADVVFIAVGTPSKAGDGHADLAHVNAAAREIARCVKGFTVVVTKSTVPVGTGDAIEVLIRETNPEADIAVVSNPEFLREGSAIEDFKRADRVLVGLEDDRAGAVMAEVYRPMTLDHRPLVFTDRRTAELTKYAANAFLAMKVTFVNEMADLCENLGANIDDVVRVMGMDRRISPHFLQAGPGFGGSCFPKDTLAIARIALDAESPLRLVEATIAVNSRRKKAMADKIIRALGGDVRGKTIGVLGLTFKANTDDMRDAPSLDILPALMAAGAKVQAFDPEGRSAKQIFKTAAFVDGPYAAAKGADGVVILTEWNQFRALDLKRLKSLMRGDVLIDLRNIYRPEEARARGFTYVSVGRP
jgi:UDPglucose 6-dehydrogenase